MAERARGRVLIESSSSLWCYPGRTSQWPPFRLLVLLGTPGVAIPQHLQLHGGGRGKRGPQGLLWPMKCEWKPLSVWVDVQFASTPLPDTVLADTHVTVVPEAWVCKYKRAQCWTQSMSKKLDLLCDNTRFWGCILLWINSAVLASERT